jgi:GLPGLI family protein
MKTNIFIGVKAYFLLGASIFSTGLVAQTLSGTVSYEETMKINVPPEFAAMMPTERKKRCVLMFTPQAGLYKADDKAQVNPGTSGMMTMRTVEADNQYYFDMEKGRYSEKHDLFGSVYLINDVIEKYEWLITDQTKDILGYSCTLATATINGRAIKAWFANGINIPLGPMEYGGLPGLILELDISNGRQVITAVGIDLRPLKKSEKIVSPTGGAKVSRSEFREIRDKRMKEIQSMPGAIIMDN